MACASCRKLQRYGVALPGADVVIAAAGHHQHQRALPEVRHGLHALPQVERQRTAAGQFQLLKLHLRILLIKAMPPLRMRRNKFCAQVGANAAKLRAGALFVVFRGAGAGNRAALGLL